MRDRWSATFAPLRTAAATLPLAWRLGLTTAACSMALAGHLIMRTAGDTSTIGLALAVIGALGAALACADLPLWRRERVGPALVPVWSTVRIGLLVLAIGGMLGLLAIGRGTPGIDVGPWVLAIWGAIIAAYVAATTPWRWPRWRWSRRSLGIIVGVGLLAAAARGWQAGAIPATLAGDEVWFGNEARSVLNGGITDPFSTGWLSVPTMTFFFNAPTIAWLSDPMLGLRLPWILLGIGNVVIAARLATRLQGPAVGIITGCGLALYHYHIHYSRIGINNIADPFFMTLALFLLLRAYDRRSSADWVLCGVAIGVAQYFYFGARLIAVVVVLSIVMMARADWRRFWRTHGAGVRRLIGAALITAAPMIQYAWRSPDEYNARINQTGIIQSGWLANELALGGNLADILAGQFWRAMLAFNVYTDRTVWYGLREPLLDPLAGTFLLIGIAIGIVRFANPRLFPMLAWWGGALLLGGFLTESPPSSQRLITAAVPTIFFAALALVMLVRQLRRWHTPWLRNTRWALPVLIAAVVAFGATSLKTYFVDYTPQRIYGGHHGVIATELGRIARREFGADWRIYFMGWPEMSLAFGSTQYLAPDTPGIDLPPYEGDAASLLVATPDLHAAFVALPLRANELELIRAAYPGGTLRAVDAPVGDEPLFWLYLVPRERLATPP